MSDGPKRAALQMRPIFDLTEGTGPVVRLVNCGQFMEALKVDAAFRITTADASGAARMPRDGELIASYVSAYGTKDEIVGRTFIQCIDVFKVVIFDPPVNEERITIEIHGIKELILEGRQGFVRNTAESALSF